MATYQFGVNVVTETLTNFAYEIRDHNGILITTVQRSPITTWDTDDADAIGLGTSITSDRLIGTAGADLFFWDWDTVQDTFSPVPPIAAARYFLPSANQSQAIDIFELGNGNDIFNLSFDQTTGGTAYNLMATAYGGNGNDLLVGGNGSDRLFGDAGADVIYGNAGNDYIDLSGTIAESPDETAYGGTGSDTMYGGPGRDTLFGGDGNDVLLGRSTLDRLLGEAGNDTLYGGDGATNAAGSNLDGGEGNDTLYGGASGDDITGGTGFLDRLYGGGGEDDLQDADGVALLDGGAGDDGMYSNFLAGWSGAPAATILGGGGRDTFSMNSALPTLNLVIQMDDGSADDSDVVSLVNVANSYGSITATLGGGGDSYFGSTGGTGDRIDIVDGGAGVDSLYGGAGADALYGGTEADSLYGGAGSDSLYGGADNDRLEGGAAADTFYGGGGVDLVTYASSAQAVTMGLNAAVGAGGDAQGDVAWDDVENLDGSAFNDSLTGNASANVIQGLGGNDTIQGLGGADSLFGGGGVDWLSYTSSATGVAVNLGTGAASGGDADGDVISGFVNLIGSTRADDLVGTSGVNTIYGGIGDDTVAGGAGADSLDGGSGAGDWLSYAGSTAVTVDLGAGSGSGGDATGDVFSGFENLLGSSGNDSLIGSAGINTIYGGAGVDTIEGGAGADSLSGGSGLNWLSYSNSSAGVNVELLIGGVVAGGDAEGDVIYDGSVTFFHLIGSNAGNDTLVGNNSGNPNTLFGLGGNDTLDGRLGDDYLDGGAGAHDWVSYAVASNPVTVNLGAGTATGGIGGDTLVGLEHVIGGGVGDFITGSAGANSLVGGNGDDVLRGGASATPLVADMLYGGAGNDRLEFDAGEFADTDGEMRAWDGISASAVAISFAGGTNVSSDRFFGGDDFDTLALSNGQDIFTVWDGNIRSNSLNYGGAGAQRLAGVELILAGGGADYILMNHLSTGGGDPSQVWTEDVTIAGMGGADTVFSGSGSDVLWGDAVGEIDGAPGDGADFLVGGAGNDTINAAGGNDVVYGGADSDVISGGDGNDTLYGGGGQDRISGNVGDDLIFGGNASAYGHEGADVFIMAFSSPGGDFEIEGGKNDPAEDGADSVYVGGRYNSVNATLGAQNDRYIADSTDSGSAQIDRVDGQLGDDLISTWYGNDELSGSEGEDALWGGAGSDTIYGGTGTDYLYGGFGNNDVLNGGPGTDYYYYSRTDGQGDQIYDDFRGTPVLPGQQADNVLVVFPDFDSTEVNGDGLRAGSGVFETDHDLYDLAGGDDMVRLTDIDGAGGSMYRLTILTGDGATNYVEFDQRDVQTILLWNNDAAPGAQVIQTYTWDPVDGRYEFVG